MTPIAIEVLLHYYYKPNPLPETPAIREALNRWVDLECLTPDLQVTPRGEEYIERLLATELKRRKYAINGLSAMVEQLHLHCDVHIGRDGTVKVDGRLVKDGDTIWY